MIAKDPSMSSPSVNLHSPIEAPFAIHVHPETLLTKRSCFVQILVEAGILGEVAQVIINNGGNAGVSEYVLERLDEAGIQYSYIC